MERALIRISAALIVSLSLSTLAIAESKPEDQIKYRQAVMSTMAGHIGAFMLITFNKVDGAAYQQSHADALANASNELDNLFPAGSGEGDTDALPEIWSNAEDFAAAVAEAQKSSASLKQAVESGNRGAIMSAFSAVGKSCKGCHEGFRAEEDHDDSHEEH